MPCKVVDLGNGATAILKLAKPWARKCVVCGRPHTKLCDFPLTNGGPLGETCDRPLCGQCAVHGEPNIDYCPNHAPTLSGGAR